jgi:hypothetical protein
VSGEAHPKELDETREDAKKSLLEIVSADLTILLSPRAPPTRPRTRGQSHPRITLVSLVSFHPRHPLLSQSIRAGAALSSSLPILRSQASEPATSSLVHPLILELAGRARMATEAAVGLHSHRHRLGTRRPQCLEEQQEGEERPECKRRRARACITASR